MKEGIEYENKLEFFQSILSEISVNYAEDFVSCRNPSASFNLYLASRKIDRLREYLEGSIVVNYSKLDFLSNSIGNRLERVEEFLLNE